MYLSPKIDIFTNYRPKIDTASFISLEGRFRAKASHPQS